MPGTYTNIAGQEPSTVTFRVGTVQIPRGTTNEQQEILVVGDPISSIAQGRVVAAAPVSTEFGQVVWIAGGPSSLVDLAVRAVPPSSAADNPVQLGIIAGGYLSSGVPSATSSGLIVQQAGFVAYSTQVTIGAGNSSVTVTAGNSSVTITAGNSSVTVAAIAAGLLSTSLPAGGSSGLNVWPVGGTITSVSSLSTGHVTVDTGSISVSNFSTTVAVSTVGGSVLIADSSGVKLGASTAAPPAGAQGLVVRVLGGSTGASAVAADQTAFTTNVTNMNPVGAWFSTTAGVVPEGAIGAMRMSSVRVAYVEPRDSTNGPITDSTQRAIRVTSVDAGGSTAVTINAIAAGLLSSAVPAAGSSGLNVWAVGGVISSVQGAIASISSLSTGHVTVDTGSISVSNFSTIVTVAAGNSSVTLAAIAAGYVSTSTPAAGSSGLNIWSVGGILSSVGGAINSVSSLSTGHVTVDTGSISVSNFSTTVNVSSLAGAIQIGTQLQSTARASSGSSGLIVRPVIDTILVTTSTNAMASTLFVIGSTATGQNLRVCAYSITSTVQSPASFTFYGGSSLKWSVRLAALSSAVSGANLAVAPPGYLFQGGAASSVNLRTKSTITNVNVSVSYYMSQ